MYVCSHHFIFSNVIVQQSHCNLPNESVEDGVKRFGMYLSNHKRAILSGYIEKALERDYFLTGW